MVSIRFKYYILTLCVLVTAWLLVAQVLGNFALLLPCLIVFLALSVWSAIQGIVIPVLLFFLPFSPLLRLQQESMSFYTIALLAVCLICLIQGSHNTRALHVIPAAGVIAIIVLAKMIYGDSFDNSFIQFSVMLLLIPLLRDEIGEKYDFYWLTLFFALGISVAALSAPLLIRFPTIFRYVKTYALYGISELRYTGFYGDANFYAAHITAALSGVLILLLKKLSKARVICLVLMAGVLLYCGLLSLSKSFFLIAVFLLLLWFLAFLFNKGKISTKIVMVLVLFASLTFVLSSTMFTDTIDAIITRLLRDNNISEFTTGRTELWEKYWHAIVSDKVLLLFGRGYTNVMIGVKSSHSTIIQVIYQFGLVGTALGVIWMIFFARNLLKNVKVRWDMVVPIALLLIGTIGPWLAIDIAFFDEFFLMPIYICYGIRFLSEKSTV